MGNGGVVWCLRPNDRGLRRGCRAPWRVNAFHRSSKPSQRTHDNLRRAHSSAPLPQLADFGYVSVLKAAMPGGRPTILPEEACGTVTHMAPVREAPESHFGVELT